MLHALVSAALVVAAPHVAPVTSAAPVRVLLDTAVAVPMQRHLALDLSSGGAVQITGSQEKVVHIKVTEDGRPCGDCGVRIEQGSDGITVHSTRPAGSGSLQFEIEVPEHFDLTLQSAGGPVSIQGVDGEIKGETAAGELDLLRLSGTVDLATKRGDVSLRQSYVNGHVHTDGGRVLLEDIGGSVEGSAQGGKVIERRVQRG